MRFIVTIMLAVCLYAADSRACQVWVGAIHIESKQNNTVGFALGIDPTPLKINVPISLLMRFCYWLPDRVAVDAHMPAHRHGMNYRPVVKQTEPGWFVAEGLLFHMPGEWELVFDLYYGERRERLTHRVTLQ